MMRNFVLGLAAGLIATWVKSMAEPALQLAGELAFPPTEDELEGRGADVTGRPENMPTAIVAQGVYENLTGSSLQFDKLLQYSDALKYAEGAATGILFSNIYSTAKFTGGMNGVPAGLTLFTLNNMALYPRMGVQEEPQFMPKAWWVWQLGSTLVFSATLVGSRKLLGKVWK